MPLRRYAKSTFAKLVFVALLAFVCPSLLLAQNVTAKTTQGFPSAGKMGRSHDFVLAEVTDLAVVDGLELEPSTTVAITAKVQPDGNVRILLDTVWFSGAMTELSSDPGVVLEKNGKPVSQAELRSRVHHGFFTMPKHTVITFTHVKLVPQTAAANSDK